jgi:membrane-associated phospholipid phosphatase
VKFLRKPLLRLLVVVPAVLVVSASPCSAEEFAVHTVLADAKLYFTAPVRWKSREWLYFGGSLAAIAGAHGLDRNVRRHFAVGDQAILNGEDPHSLRDALPAALVVAGTWTYASVIDESSGRVEAYTMLEAAGFSAVTTEALKVAAGRVRPNETTDENLWRQSGSSFPSLHTSAAFAIGTVFAESGSDDSRWFRRVVGYGAAGATAYLRAHDNVHWFSDTVAGAAIGIATAHFTMNRRDERARRMGLALVPMRDGGMMLSLRMANQ